MFFLIFAQNIDCGYTLEPPRREPMQGFFFSLVKFENFITKKKLDIFLIFAPNIDCGYALEPPRQ